MSIYIKQTLDNILNQFNARTHIFQVFHCSTEALLFHDFESSQVKILGLHLKVNFLMKFSDSKYTAHNQQVTTFISRNVLITHYIFKIFTAKKLKTSPVVITITP